MKLVTTWIKTLAVSATLVFLCSSANAVAVQHTYNFTASDFTIFLSGHGWVPAPLVEPVSGSITATFDGDVTSSGSIDAINITTSTHTFTVDEVGFKVEFGFVIFGGILNGLDEVSSSTNDFWLNFDLHNFSFGDFTYSTFPLDPRGKIFTSTILEVNEGSVPEPATIALLGLGLLGFVAARRRNKQ